VNGVSVLICTYNRESFLGETLAALSDLRQPDCDVEIVVVDNNSTDLTRQVIEDAAGRSPVPIEYVFEPRQGKSFALNTGLSRARGDIIALTDDDVLPGPQWLDGIVSAFRRADVTFVSGKVLPRWGCLPPAELLTERAHEIWGPLAILDYGDRTIEYTPDAQGQKLPVGANLAFARQALEHVGGWRTDLGKVDNTLISGEDHEIFFRLRRAGLYRGLYDPAIVVRHHVPGSRMTRRYFRRWFYWHGRTLARMTEEIYAPLDLSQVPHIANVPRFLYRQALQQFFKWLRRVGSRDALEVLIEELQAIEYLGFFAERWRPHASHGGRSRHTDSPPAARSSSLAGSAQG
jgi:glycosyltransferase involved in cell wall biosynthesis